MTRLRDPRPFGGLAATLLLAGCAFHAHNQSPIRPETLQLEGEPIQASVGVQFVPEAEGAICGETFQRFVGQLRDRRVFASVVSPMQAEDVPGVVLKAQFNCRVDRHDVRNSIVAFFEGFGMLLPALLALHDLDITVEARVTTHREDRTIARYDLASRYDADAGYFGIVNHPERELEMSRLADQYAIDQVISRFRADRLLFEAPMPTP